LRPPLLVPRQAFSASARNCCSAGVSPGQHGRTQRELVDVVHTLKRVVCVKG
jgi:hypothetical protein